jgi:hypothetical protein
LENISENYNHEKSNSEKVYGTNPKWISIVGTFGEMAIVARYSDKKARKKLANHVKTDIIIGNSDHHEKDIYMFLKTQTKKPILSRDVIW